MIRLVILIKKNKNKKKEGKDSKKKFHFRPAHWRTTEPIRSLAQPASRFISGARRTNAESRKCFRAQGRGSTDN